MDLQTMGLLNSDGVVKGISRATLGDHWIADLLVWFADYATTTERIIAFGIAALSAILVVYTARFAWIKIKNYRKGNAIRTDYATRYERFICWLPMTKSTVERYQNLPGSFDYLTEDTDDSQ